MNGKDGSLHLTIAENGLFGTYHVWTPGPNATWKDVNVLLDEDDDILAYVIRFLEEIKK